MVMLMSHTRFCAHLFMTSVFMLATGCADNESGEVIVIVGADVGVEDGGEVVPPCSLRIFVASAAASAASNTASWTGPLDEVAEPVCRSLH